MMQENGQFSTPARMRLEKDRKRQARRSYLESYFLDILPNFRNKIFANSWQGSTRSTKREDKSRKKPKTRSVDRAAEVKKAAEQDQSSFSITASESSGTARNNNSTAINTRRPKNRVLVISRKSFAKLFHEFLQNRVCGKSPGWIETPHTDRFLVW